MAEKIYMIALSPTMEVGTIVTWNKDIGDDILSGDVICEVETDKATMDYESTQEGTLLKIVVSNGGTAKVGDVVGIIGEKGEDIGDIAVASQTSQEEALQASHHSLGCDTQGIPGEFDRLFG